MWDVVWIKTFSSPSLLALNFTYDNVAVSFWSKKTLLEVDYITREIYSTCIVRGKSIFTHLKPENVVCYRSISVLFGDSVNGSISLHISYFIGIEFLIFLELT